MDLDAIKAATWHLHARAERSGIIADILSGRATRRGVALLLRNLLPVYQVLDGSPLCTDRALTRSAAIEADLAHLSPDNPLPLLTEGAAYADRIRKARDGDASALLGHAYVRYLGDLNGGQIMRRALLRCLGESAGQLRFLEYPTLPDRAAFAVLYRSHLDRAVQAADGQAIQHEVTAAFELNIALSDAVRRMVGPAS